MEATRLYGGGSIAVNGSGEVYVSDNSSDEVKVYDGLGSFITKWSSWEGGMEKFSYPSLIAVDKNNQVLVYDYSKDKIMKFSSRGIYDSSLNIDAGISLRKLIIDDENNLLVSIQSFRGKKIAASLLPSRQKQRKLLSTNFFPLL